MEISNNNKPQEVKEKVKVTTKSQILLPILFILSLAFFLLSVLKEDFKEGLSPFVIWAYFVVVLLYVGIALFDAFFLQKEKKKKIYVLIFSILNCIADILFIIFIR